MLQRRKRYKNRTILGFKTLAGGVINMAQVGCFLIQLPLSIFIGPCIVIYSYSTTNKMHLLSQIIYFCKTLYMFRSFRPSSGAQDCTYSNRHTSNSCCYLLLSAMRWTVSQIIYSCKTLYIFRTVFPSIIRSSRLHIQQQAYVEQLLLPAASSR